MDAYEAIRLVMFRYCDTIDRGDFEATGALFTPDATYGPIGRTPAVGGASVTAALERNVLLYNGVPSTRHNVSNVMIELGEDGVSATAQSYLHVLHQAPGGPIITMVAGTYFDRFVLADGEWRFAARSMDIELVGDMSTHLRVSSFRPRAG